MNDPVLTEALHRLAEESRPVRIPPDIWRRGQRRRRRRIGTALAALLVALTGTPLLLPAMLGTSGGGMLVGADRPVVPARVYPPLTGEATIIEDPPGPAALVISGDQELRGSDIWGWEGRSLLVGQDGNYRLARTVGETRAGIGDLLLSPDGRRIAAEPWIEGSQWPEDPAGQTAILDLTTGEVRQYSGGLPVAWAPDGRSLLVLTPNLAGYSWRLGRLSLLDPDTGALRQLPEITGSFRPGNFAAFAPDGSRLAIATIDALHLIDLTDGTTRILTPLTPRDRIAGPGAWLPGGDRIAIWSMGDCEDGETGESCDEKRLARRSIQIGYRDARTGATVSGPALPLAHGLAARLLGWQRDGDAVVAEYQPEKGVVKGSNDLQWSETDWWVVGSVQLREFRTDGSRPELVKLPSSALFIDVPTNLLDDFGGPSPSLPEGVVRWLLAIWWPVGQFLEGLVVLVASIVGWRRLSARRRRLRHRLPGPRTGETDGPPGTTDAG